MRHPAKFTKQLWPYLQKAVPLPEFRKVLDPFAGTGLIHEILPDHETIGIEIEPEWAEMHPRNVCGDALDLPDDWENFFDAIITSPTYGNRMADHHEAKDGSFRSTYRHTLGRPLHENNSGGMQWGDKYREFHAEAWAEAERVLRPGGRFVLNIKDHIRKGQVVPVSIFHVDTLQALGFVLIESEAIDTPGSRFGANADLRMAHEWVHIFEKPLVPEG